MPLAKLSSKVHIVLPAPMRRQLNIVPERMIGQKR